MYNLFGFQRKLNYEEMNANHEVITEFCSKYRPELIAIGGIIAERNGLANAHEYIRFMKDLSIDEFVGNYLVSLLNNNSVKMYRNVLDGKMTFTDFVKTQLGNELTKKFEKFVNEAI